jgi:hypothetical protein
MICATLRLASANVGNELATTGLGSVAQLDLRMGAAMSYDLAVWEGVRPPTDIKALQEFRRLYDALFNRVETLPASPQIESYVAKLIDRWPDLTTGAEAERSAWVQRPLLSNASGSLIYFAVRSSRAVEVAAYAAQLAADAGLVCFDPQTGQLC